MDWQCIEDLRRVSEDLIFPLVLSLAATLVYVTKSGWHGVADFLAKWTVASFCGVMAHWVALHYGISGTLNAVIISMTALLSHLIIDLIFHPQIQTALRARLVREITRRGAGDRSDG